MADHGLDVECAVVGLGDRACDGETESAAARFPAACTVSGDTEGRNSWETLAIDDPAKDDLAFVSDLLDLMIQDYCVDETRVYSTGMSGGGLFTSQLVCEIPGRLAAAASPRPPRRGRLGRGHLVSRLR